MQASRMICKQWFQMENLSWAAVAAQQHPHVRLGFFRRLQDYAHA